jgi:hypothetical protein
MTRREQTRFIACERRRSRRVHNAIRAERSEAIEYGSRAAARRRSEQRRSFPCERRRRRRILSGLRGAVLRRREQTRFIVCERRRSRRLPGAIRIERSEQLDTARCASSSRLK